MFILEWLTEGKSIDDIKHDLIKRGHTQEDAREIAIRIGTTFLAKEESVFYTKQVRDGSLYRLTGWLIVAFAIVVSIFFMPVIFGWFVFVGLGGVGFSLIRYGNHLESHGIIPRERGFRRFKSGR